MMEQTIEKDQHIKTIEALAKAHKIEPLKAGESATYQVLNSRLDPKTNIPHYAPSVQVNNNATILHPRTKLPEKLVYIESVRPIKRNGFTELEEVTPLIFIEGGQKVVGPREQLLYYHLEMSDENESKIGRDTSIRAKFKRLDRAKSAKEVLEQERDLEYVMTLVRTMSVETLKAAAEKYKVNTDREIDEIRHDINVLAKKDPQGFIRNSPNVLDKLRMMVKDAKVSGIVEYDGTVRKWAIDGKEALEVEVGADSEEMLVEFLHMNDPKSKAARKLIQDKLKGN